MKQQTLAMAADQESRFEQHRRPTRHGEFLETMNRSMIFAVCVALSALT